MWCYCEMPKSPSLPQSSVKSSVKSFETPPSPPPPTTDSSFDSQTGQATQPSPPSPSSFRRPSTVPALPLNVLPAHTWSEDEYEVRQCCHFFIFFAFLYFSIFFGLLFLSRTTYCCSVPGLLHTTQWVFYGFSVGLVECQSESPYPQHRYDYLWSDEEGQEGREGPQDSPTDQSITCTSPVVMV